MLFTDVTLIPDPVIIQLCAISELSTNRTLVIV